MIFFEQTMRWYGPEDPVSLSDIRQAGATAIVTALHDVPNGEIWTTKAIQERKASIESAGMVWSVVESLPVHEAIKTRNGDFEKYIENYKISLKNLASEGIHTICYNFMPVLDWTRTDLQYELPDGGKALRFEMPGLVAFDAFILKRPKAKADYTKTEWELGKMYYESLSSTEKEGLTKAIIAGLPGAEEGYTLEQFQEALDTYTYIDAAILAENLRLFQEAIIPVIEAHGVYMAIHPDDPPFPIFGLPRVMSTALDVDRMLAQNRSPNNGITFCTGSFGVRPDNKLLQMIEEYGSYIHFVHLRSTQGDGIRNFYEAAHLEGDVPMFEVMKAFFLLQQQKGVSLPMRPDHGHQLLDDLYKNANPGYTAIGRLKGLAELRGLEYGISKMVLE